MKILCALSFGLWLAPIPANAEPTPLAQRSPTIEVSKLALAGALSSQDELIQRFVAAIEANDKAAMMELLVTLEDYRDIIIPGTVAPGQAPRQWSEKSRQYFAEHFRHKNGLFADVLLKDFGGKKLTVKSVSFTENEHEYAWYRARGELRLAVDAAPSVETSMVLRTGFIGIVNDGYLFIGFQYDDD